MRHLRASRIARMGVITSIRVEERGSVTVVAAGVIAIVLIATVGVADVGGAILARARAQQAADAAALAAAQELALSTGADPGAVAGTYASRNGAVLTACTCAAGTTAAQVQVRVDLGHLVLLPGTHQVFATARAVVDGGA